jgi:glycosyltransferase involved in cell wall biosynthesis
MELAVVYPVYNEAEILRQTAEKTINYLKDQDLDNFTVVYVSDGSTDGTQDKADRLAEEVSEVQHLRYSERLGKGKAFEKAFYRINAEKFAYCDADLSTELKHLEDLQKLLDKGQQIAVGSRRISRGFERGFMREMPSIFFNELIAWLFGSGIKDHQCGFKGFRKEKDVEELFEEVESKHWFWDAEMLVRAQRKGLKIKEFTVKWEESSDSKVNVFSDSIYFLKETAKLRVKLWRE